MVDWLAPQIPVLLGKAQALGQQFIGWIGEQAAPILSKLQTWAQSFVAWVVPAATKFLQEWPGQFDRFLTWIGNQAGPLLAKLGEWALQFVSWIAPMIPKLLLAAAAIAAAILLWIGQTAVVLLNKINNEWVPAFTDWIRDNVVPKLGSALGAIDQAIARWISGTAVPWAKRELAAVGAAIVDGIEAGISNAWGSLLGWVQSQIEKLPAAVRTALGIGSPSKVFADIGRTIPAGLAQGIVKELPLIERAMAATTRSTVGGVTVPVSYGALPALPRGAPISAASTSTGSQYSTMPIGGGRPVNVYVTVTGNTMLGRDPSVAQELADVIAPELRRRLAY